MSELRTSDDHLATALHRLSTVVLSSETTDAILSMLVTLATSSLAAADGASFSLRREGEILETSHATSAVMRSLDDLQYETGEGPCVAAIRDGQRHHIDIAGVADSWPRFAAAAASHGVQTVLSTPLAVDDRVSGALNLYSLRSSSFGPDQVLAAQSLADHASVVVDNALAYDISETTNRHLRDALDARTVIGQAQGIIMTTFSCTAEEAFARLRHVSQHTNQKLRDVAAQVVDGSLPATDLPRQ